MSPVARNAWHALVRRGLRLRSAYARAAVAVDEPGLRSVLEENAQWLDPLIAEWRVQGFVAPGKDWPGLHWLRTTHRHVETWRTHAMPRSDVQWIRLLARHEDALLRSFEQVLAGAPVELAPLLCRQWPRLNAIHRDMRSLSRAVGC